MTTSAVECREFQDRDYVKAAELKNLFHNGGAAKTLTGSFVDGDAWFVQRHGSGTLFITYAKGTEASADIEFLISPDGTNWFPATFHDVPVGGVASPANDIQNLAASITRAFIVSFASMPYFTVRCRGNTIGGAPGSLLITGWGGTSL